MIKVYFRVLIDLIFSFSNRVATRIDFNNINNSWDFDLYIERFSEDRDILF